MKVMFVGEQPGNEEDLSANLLSVRPAVCSTMRWKRQASIANKLTSPMSSNISNGNRAANAVFTKNPTALEIAACRPWLEAEIALVKPDVIVALGATAAQSLLGPQFRVTKQRGEFIRFNPCSLRHGYCSSFLYSARSGR